MPFSIRRFTLQRSLSSNERSKADMVGAGRAIKKSASQEESRSSGRLLTASRSADQGDLGASSPQQPPLEWAPTPQVPPQLPPRYPAAQRSTSVDRASASLLARWRHAGRSKSASISEPRDYPLDERPGPPRPPRSSTRTQGRVSFQKRMLEVAVLFTGESNPCEVL